MPMFMYMSCFMYVLMSFILFGLMWMGLESGEMVCEFSKVWVVKRRNLESHKTSHNPL